MSSFEVTIDELLNTPRQAFDKVAKLRGFEAAFSELEHMLLKHCEKNADEDGELDPVLKQEIDDVWDSLREATIESAMASSDPQALRRLYELSINGSENYWVEDSRSRTKPTKIFLEAQVKLARGEEGAMSEWIIAMNENINGPCTVEIHHRRKVVVRKTFPAYTLPPSDPNEGKIITP